MRALETLGGETWFRLGDADLALHVERTRRLAAGEPLESIVCDVARRFGIPSRILPMTEAPVRTIIQTSQGEIGFQDYFVRQRCAPAVRRLRFAGASQANIGAGAAEATGAERREPLRWPPEPRLDPLPGRKLIATPARRMQTRPGSTEQASSHPRE